MTCSSWLFRLRDLGPAAACIAGFASVVGVLFIVAVAGLEFLFTGSSAPVASLFATGFLGGAVGAAIGMIFQCPLAP